MIQIYICDDEPQQLKILKKAVLEIIQAEYLNEMEVACATKDPSEIIERIEKNEFSVYFLDIDLGNDKMSGLDLAVEIRKYNTKAYIVMITAYDGFAIDTYNLQIGVKDYIMKGDSGAMAARMKKCLKDMYNAVQTPETRHDYLKIGGAYNINLKEIYYIMARPDEKRRVDINMKTGTSIAPISLKEIILQKHKDLFQCHRSYVININNIKEIDYDNREIIMANGATISVGRRRARLLKHKLSSLR